MDYAHKKNTYSISVSFGMGKAPCLILVRPTDPDVPWHLSLGLQPWSTARTESDSVHHDEASK